MSRYDNPNPSWEEYEELFGESKAEHADDYPEPEDPASDEFFQ